MLDAMLKCSVRAQTSSWAAARPRGEGRGEKGEEGKRKGRYQDLCLEWPPTGHALHAKQ